MTSWSPTITLRGSPNGSPDAALDRKIKERSCHYIVSHIDTGALKLAVAEAEAEAELAQAKKKAEAKDDGSKKDPSGGSGGKPGPGGPGGKAATGFA